MGRKELVVSALENGTVLDHIPAENVYKALDILNLKGIESQITIGINLASKLSGKKGIEYIETTSLDEYLNDCDILYMTRVQQERFTDPMEYERVKDVYTLSANMLGNVKENMKILHPLPRVTEITQDVDETPYAYYFKQAENGLYVRMAIISYLLGYR